MIIRERATVVQLYRSVYDPATKRSRTQYLGAFAKFGEPTAQLFAKLADSERQRLESFLAAQVAAREAIRGRYFFSDAPAQLRGGAASRRAQKFGAGQKLYATHTPSSTQSCACLASPGYAQGLRDAQKGWRWTHPRRAKQGLRRTRQPLRRGRTPVGYLNQRLQVPPNQPQ